MKNKLIIAFAGLFLTFAAAQKVLADDRYFSVGYEMQSWDIDVDGLDDFSIGYLTGKAGFKLTEGVYFEGKFGLGINDDSIRGINTTVTVDPEMMLGGFFVFNNSINEQFDIYAKAGLNYFSYDVKGKADEGYKYFDGSTTISSSESETKLAIGAGMNYFFDTNNGLNLELSVPSIGDLGDIGAFTIGYVHRM